MPKDRRVNSSSFDRSMVSPYSCSLKISDCNSCNSSSSHVGDEKEWEEARCPICMEHPHNAVLLICSSREKGCRPFICDTSYRHSNCLDQFRKSAAASSLQSPFEEQCCELVCPLCRGLVSRWDVIQPARTFMNSKTRSCSLETCDFSGNYAELRKHARLEHPLKRPSEASPTRQSNWAMLEQQREIEDVLAHQSDIEYDLDGWPSWDEWGEDDFWSDGSFFDFPSGMSDIEDELIDEMFNGLSLSLFSLYSSPNEEMIDSGSSRSSDRLQRTALSTNSGSRSNNHIGSALHNSRSRSSYHSEDGAIVSRSRSGYHRENDTTNLRSISSFHRENGSTNLSSRSSYQGENDATNLRFISSFHTENGSANLSSRSSYHRGNGSTSLSTRSSYPRENGSTVSRSQSTYQREIAPASSRTRSSYHREDARPNSRARARSRFYLREFASPVRSSTARRLPGSSRQPHSSYGRRGE